jgi:hypothetical protein
MRSHLATAPHASSSARPRRPSASATARRRTPARAHGAPAYSDAVEELLERERELTALAGLLQRGGEIVVVEGGARVGKTSLLQAACRQAAAHRARVRRVTGRPRHVT